MYRTISIYIYIYVYIYIMHGDIAYMIVRWDYQYIMGLI